VLLTNAEIEPDFVHPQNGKTMQELTEICTDNGKIKKYIHL